MTGAHAGDPGAVEVLLDRSQQRHFSRLFIAEPFVIGARAVAALTGGKPACPLALSPTASGPFSALLIFGSRSDTGVTHRINGNAGSTLDVAIHAPASSMRYSGNFGGSGGCAQIVVDRITFTGNSDLAVGADRRRDRRA